LVAPLPTTRPLREVTIYLAAEAVAAVETTLFNLVGLLFLAVTAETVQQLRLLRKQALPPAVEVEVVIGAVLALTLTAQMAHPVVSSSPCGKEQA